MSPLLGVDVSEFQGVIDWHAVAASGVAFALARATFGANKVDARYPANKVGIPAAGLVPGAYHFLTHEPPSAQADAFVRWADPHAIHALDVEYPTVDVAGWVRAYRTHYPRSPLVIYTGRDLWRAAVGTAWGSGPLWLAGYEPDAYVGGSGTLATQWAKVGAANGGLPWAGWSGWTLMQFTDTAVVPGITGHVDGDAFSGSLNLLRDLAGSTDMEPTTVIDVPGSDPATTTTVGHAIGAVYEVAASDLWGRTARAAAAAAAAAAQTQASNLAIQQQLTALQTTLAGLTMPAPAPVDVQKLATELVIELGDNHVSIGGATADQIVAAFVTKLRAALG